MQLTMRWKNDGSEAEELILPEGFSITTLPELENGIATWLDVVAAGLTGTRRDPDYYKIVMEDIPCYDANRCFIITSEGKAVATITVICNPHSREGLIHMVACDPACRGKGLGTLMSKLAVMEMKAAGMQTGMLHTDKWRIPAIKSYLRAGFLPDLTIGETREDWEEVFRILEE